MKAVVLAAGFGRRMVSEVPKPLVPVFGLPLIEYKIRKLKGFKVGVVYHDEEVASYLKRKFPEVTLIYNPHPERENGFSLYCAKEFVGNDRFVLVMADHYYSDEFFSTAKRLKEGNFLLVSPFSYNPDEATKVKTENDRILRIGKRIEDYDYFDTGFFVLSPQVFQVAKELLRRERFTLSDLMQELAERGELFFKVVKGKWIDVDEKEEIKLAEKVIKEDLIKDTDGPISKLINRKISTLITPTLLRFDFITPNFVTILSSTIGFLGAILFLGKHYLAGGIVTQLSSILDGCDGEIARLKNIKTKFGGVLDSLLDRYVDTFILLSLFLNLPVNKLNVLSFFLAVTGSILVSYVSHLSGKRPLFATRDVRLFILFCFSLLTPFFGEVMLNYALWTIAILSHMGVVYTLAKAYKE
ncbi:MAG: CDP-alcohol phosphatidyltransferase [Desulfurobacterium sp.]|nr:MAG: CDP-alcohol phosphatidyltransferase [Desulfurobacterium sp.]